VLRTGRNLSPNRQVIVSCALLVGHSLLCFQYVKRSAKVSSIGMPLAMSWLALRVSRKQSSGIDI